MENLAGVWVSQAEVEDVDEMIASLGGMKRFIRGHGRSKLSRPFRLTKGVQEVEKRQERETNICALGERL